MTTKTTTITEERLLTKGERLQEIFEYITKADHPVDASDAVNLLTIAFDTVESRYALPFQQKKMWIRPLKDMVHCKVSGYLLLYDRHLLRVTDKGEIFIYNRGRFVYREDFLVQYPLYLKMGMSLVFSKKNAN